MINGLKTTIYKLRMFMQLHGLLNKKIELQCCQNYTLTKLLIYLFLSFSFGSILYFLFFVMNMEFLSIKFSE